MPAVKKSGLSRRDFLKLVGAGGVGLAFAPFVPFGNFMPNPRQAVLERVPAILPDGTHANIKSYPVNHAETITYPATGDPALDAEAFRKWHFIRLPEELGGSKDDLSAIRAYSAICLHLWCIWSYGLTGENKGHCPCHGSKYDPVTGRAIEGPAEKQAPPSNILPRLPLEIDGEGFVYINPPDRDVGGDGVVGFGRL